MSSRSAHMPANSRSRMDRGLASFSLKNVELNDGAFLDLYVLKGLENAILVFRCDHQLGPSKPMRSLASQVLDTFHSQGLYTAKVNPDGSASIVLTKLPDSQYKAAKKKLPSGPYSGGVGPAGRPGPGETRHRDRLAPRRLSVFIGAGDPGHSADDRKITEEIRVLTRRLAQENQDWGPRRSTVNFRSSVWSSRSGVWRDICDAWVSRRPCQELADVLTES